MLIYLILAVAILISVIGLVHRAITPHFLDIYKVPYYLVTVAATYYAVALITLLIAKIDYQDSLWLDNQNFSTLVLLCSLLYLKISNIIERG